MTVGELIAALSHYDPSLRVVNAKWESYQLEDLARVGNALMFDHSKEPKLMSRDMSEPVLERNLPGEDTKSNPGPVPSKRHELLQGPEPVGVMTEAGEQPPPPLKLKEVGTPLERKDPSADQPFPNGVLVCLKSGGPIMTVEGVGPDGMVAAVWFVDGQCHRDAFYPGAISRSSSR